MKIFWEFCDRATAAATDAIIAGIATGTTLFDVDKAVVYIATAAATDAMIAGIATGTTLFDVDKAIIYIGGLHEKSFLPYFKEL